MQLNFVIGLPSIIIDIINLTSLELDFLDVLISTKSVDFGSTDTDGREEGLLLNHRRTMDDVPINILQAVIAHSTNQEPRANVGVLFDCQRVLALTSAIDIERSEVTWEFSAVLGDQAPLRELFLLGSFNIESTDLIASEFEPEHVIGQVQHQMVLFGVLFEELTLRHQILLRLLLVVADEIAL